MGTQSQSSLTGTEIAPPPTHSAAVSIALARLRFGIVFCCWAIGIALLIETVVWSLSAYTDLRWTEIVTGEAQAPLIVTAAGAGGPVRSALDEAAAPGRQPVNANRVLSRFDRIFSILSSIAGGVGTLALLLLVPFVALGVLLAASAPIRGVDRTVSAFGWAVVVMLLALPLGRLIGLPWEDGALARYSVMVTQIDGLAVVEANGGNVGSGETVALARFLLLPLAALAGIALVGLTFSTGVEEGLLRKEDLRLDATLEREAGGVKTSSLYGGRTTGAMQATTAKAKTKSKVEAGSAPPPPPPPPAPAPAGAKAISPEPPPPRRLI